MRLWINLPDPRPSSPYLAAWLDHLDGSIAHRIQSHVFARDWKWLVMVPPSHPQIVRNPTFAARYSPALSSFWMTSDEIDRLERQARASAAGFPGFRSRPPASFPDTLYRGALNASLRCKELALNPVSPPPADRDFFPYMFFPDDPLRFTHGLSLRLGLLTGRELHQTLQTVERLLRSHVTSVPVGTDVSWRAGVEALQLIMRQWPEGWSLWGEEHMSLRRSALRSLEISKAPPRRLLLEVEDEYDRLPSGCNLAGCDLFVHVVRHVLSRSAGHENGHEKGHAGVSRQRTTLSPASPAAGPANGHPGGQPPERMGDVAVSTDASPASSRSARPPSAVTQQLTLF